MLRNNNICKFIPAHHSVDVINTINFVYETKEQVFDKLKISAVYIMHYVTEGKGWLHMVSGKYELHAGDIFFVLPAVPYYIESQENFKYLYISYIGIRANMLMERLKIDSRNLLFKGFQNLHEFWRNALEISDLGNIDMLSESVLLYTFSVIENEIMETDYLAKSTNGVLLIKKYIDENFSDSDMSLEKISREFSYNKKYISTTFKKQMKTGISKYLNTIRIQNACTLIEQGFTCVKDIAFLCGYTDQMYFSKIFKNKIGVSPREHMLKLRLELQ